jgi:hypothetical protein
MKNLLLLLVIVVLIIVACSSGNYLINEWAIRDVKSLDEWNPKMEEIIKELTQHGHITFTKEHQYQFYTPYGTSNGRWFMKRRNREYLFTISENNDTVKNKIVKYTKDNVILESLQPGSRMVIDLIPKTRN